MLEAGWPVDTLGEMGATALHWAGFNGNSEMTRQILRFHPALELKSREYEGDAATCTDIFGKKTIGGNVIGKKLASSARAIVF